MSNWRALLLGLLGLLVLGGCDRGPSGPAFIKDPAGLLTPAAIRQLVALHERLLKEIDLHLAVVILDSPSPDLDAAARELFEAYGQKSLVRAARGVMLVVDPQSRRVRLETGYDLQEIFSDRFVRDLEARQMRPFFASGQIADGVAATVERLVAKAFEPGAEAPPVTAMPPLDHPPALEGIPGSGASADGAAAPVAVRAADFRPQETPLATLGLYLQVLRRHLVDPGLELYTPATRRFLQRWQPSTAQQDRELRALDRSWGQATVISNGPLAVVRFPIAERQVAPYFLCRKPHGWQLDLAARGRLVGRNHHGQWFFRNLDHGYMFAFADWQFDAHGFPHRSLDGR